MKEMKPIDRSDLGGFRDDLSNYLLSMVNKDKHYLLKKLRNKEEIVIKIRKIVKQVPLEQLKVVIE